MNTLRTATAIGLSAAFLGGCGGGDTQPAEHTEHKSDQAALRQQKKANVVAAAAATRFTERLIAQRKHRTYDLIRPEVDPKGTARNFDGQGTNKLSMSSISYPPRIAGCDSSNIMTAKAEYKGDKSVKASKFYIETSEYSSGKKCRQDGEIETYEFKLVQNSQGRWLATTEQATLTDSIDDDTRFSQKLTSPDEIRAEVSAAQDVFEEFARPLEP